ncbi:MAG TPA: hydroxymethylbilane synthase [Solirubrobacteraceae bacterium]|nr:hydroxymethylbilane synthase [Solirubrobacteraceae bacterium]
MRIGTRGSVLALAQARWVADRIHGPAELVTITTSGDRGQQVGDKARWVSALERALLDGEIDCAVHSAKDVPAELPDGLALVAFPERANPFDAICGAPSLAALPAGARLGTSSLRRAAQVRAHRDDVEVVEIRGNVDTRLRKLAAGEVDALILARAGLERLGRAGEAGGSLEALVPAAGQGALAIEARDSAEAAAALAALDDPATSLCVLAERELVHALGASCNTPVGAHARLVDGGELELRAWAGLPDGSAWVADQLRGSPRGLGAEVARRMQAAGAAELLEAAEAAANAGLAAPGGERR